MAPAEINEHVNRIAVPGGEVFVKTWKPANPVTDIPIFLFHDSLGCVELWRDFPQLLCEKFQRPIIAYDRLGFGQSSERTNLPSLNFINEEAEIYFPSILKSLGVREFDLFGHSVGGAMAIVCAALIPGCRSVVTESAQAFVESRTREGIEKAKENFNDPSHFDRLVKYHGSKAAWVLKAWIDIWLSPEFANWSLKPWLEKVQCPVLALHGDQDEFGSRAFPEMIHHQVKGPSEMQLLSNCGHVPHRQMPELVLSSLKRFYQSRVSS